MTAQPRPDLDAIQTRHHIALDPDACGTCRRNVVNGQPPEHEQCNRRAMLLPAPDQPDWEQILDIPEDERAQLPARFHIPVWEGNAEPNSWLCAVCWGDGWVSSWPCATATEKGKEVFAAAHHGERARWDVTRLAARVAELEQQLAAAPLADWATELATAGLNPYDGTLTLGGDDQPFARIHLAFHPDMDDADRAAFLTTLGRVVLRAL